MAVAEERVVVQESFAARAGRWLARTPVYLVIAFIGILWLVPTIGLFFTSVLDPSVIGRVGWWHVLSSPSEATFQNYRAIFDNDQITSSILTTMWVAIGGTLLPMPSHRSPRTRSRGSSSPGATGSFSSWSRCSSCRCRWR